MRRAENRYDKIKGFSVGFGGDQIIGFVAWRALHNYDPFYLVAQWRSIN